MKLYYSVTSPYSRKVLLLAKSLGMGGEVEIIHSIPLENDPDFLRINPLGKVPALIQGGKVFFDSPYIVEHLLMLAGQDRTGEDYMERLGVQALADGMMDALFSLRAESTRPDSEQSAMWKKRWFTSVERGLDMLEARVIDTLSGWKLDSISVACMLDYLCFRQPDMNWQANHPKSAAWFTKMLEKQDIIDTDPRKG